MFELDLLHEIPAVKKTEYPKFKQSYSNIIKKDDVLIQIDRINIIDGCIYNIKYNLTQKIDEYLTYIIQEKNKCVFTLVRQKITLLDMKSHNVQKVYTCLISILS